MEKANTFRELAKALGVSVGRVHALSKTTLPPRGPDGWDVAACVRALGGESAAAEPMPTPTSEGLASTEGERDVLRKGDDPLAIARAAVGIAARALADSTKSGTSSAVESLKTTLEELRRTEAAVLRLQIEKGEVVELEVACAAAARAGRRFVDALERLEVRFASQVQHWMSDPAFRALHTEGQVRAVRAWVLEQTLAARSLEADEIAKMIATEAADR